MDEFWNSCIGSQIIGYYNDKTIFIISVYSISKPTVYKIILYPMGDNLYFHEKETKNIIKKIISEHPVRIKFIKHEEVNIEQFIVPPIKISFLDKKRSSKSGAVSPESGANSPKSGINSPKSGINSPKSGTNSPKSGINSPKSGAVSPKSGANSPKSGANSPKSGINSPKSGAVSPKSGTNSPKSVKFKL